MRVYVFACVCVCVCVCVCMHKCLYVRLYVCMCVCMYVCMYVCMCVCQEIDSYYNCYFVCLNEYTVKGDLSLLFVYLLFYFQLTLHVVELDPSVVDIAQDWFGFVKDERMTVAVSDGLDFVTVESKKGNTQILNAVA